MPDPRFDRTNDVMAVQLQPGWYSLEHIASLHGGSSYTDDADGWMDDARWVEFYATTAATVRSPHLARFYLKMNGTAQDSMEGSAVRAEMYCDVTGTVLSSQAIHAETVVGTLCTTVNGYVTALRGILTIDTVSKTFSGGVFAAAFLTMNIGASITAAARTSFIAIEDLGTLKSNYLIDSGNVAHAADGVWATDAGAVGGTVLGYYKVFTAAGAGYIAVYSSHS